MSSRRALMLIVLLLALPAGVPGRSLAGDLHGASRGMWIWDDPSPAQARYAARRGYDNVYVHFTPGAAERARVRALVRTAARKGVGVWAMGGHAAWAIDPAPMVAFAREAVRHGRFSGIVLDVEPHVLDEWDDPVERLALMRSFLRGLERVAGVAGEMPVLVAVPFWFDHDGYRLGAKTLFRHVLDRVDGVVVMAYRDRAVGGDGIVNLAAGEVHTAGVLGKTAIVGVQASPDDLDKLGFAEEGMAAMERELAIVHEAFAEQQGFGGVAVHHYRSIRALAR